MNERQLSPFLSTGDPASFAMRTMLERKFNIINDVIAQNSFDDATNAKLLAFKDEIRHGFINDPFVNFQPEETNLPATEIQIWRMEISRYQGTPWIGIPWYFAEAYFYLRLMLAIGYYETDSSYYLYDPFQPLKQKELVSERGGVHLGKTILQYLETLKETYDKTHALVFFALWGNRIDLSNYQVAQQLKDQLLSRDHDLLLVDHVNELIHALLYAKRVDTILDNAGPELVCDLLMAWYLLHTDEHKTFYFHAKRAPFFVSDAIPKDIHETIDAFVQDTDSQLSKIGQELARFIKEERLITREHHYWNGPLQFCDFPEDIRNDLAQSDLVILKGDANYRRLLSDRKWLPSTPMEEVTAYFPASFAVLRTMKAELVVDIDEKTYANLFHEDRDWMLNGKRGIIRLVRKPEQ